MTPKVAPLETLLAIKILLFVPGLSAAERQVAGVIIEHFNRTHGRCDPGVDRIGELLGIDRSTVLRAIGSLHKRNIIGRTRHGGHSQRNSYAPNWELLRKQHETWNERFRAGNDRRDEVTEAPPVRSQECHPGGGMAATQTFLKNLQNEPAGAAPPANTAYTGGRGEATSGPARKGSIRSASPARPKGQASSQAAEAAATRHWDNDLRDHLRDRPEAYAFAVDHIDEKLQTEATAAEMRKRGAGVDLILRSLRSSAVPQGGHRGAPGDPVNAGDSGPRAAGSLSGPSKPKVEPKLKAKEPPTGDAAAAPHEARVLSGPLPLAGISNPDDKPVRLAKTRPDNP